MNGMSPKPPPYDEAPRAANPFRTAPGSDPPQLAGRDDELARVRTSVMLARERETPVPLVFTGLRGMGKTALLRRSLSEARAAGGVVLSAEAAPETSLFAAMRRSLERARDESASLSRRIGTAFDALAERLPKASLTLPDGLGSLDVAAAGSREADPPFLDALGDLNVALRRVGRFLVVALDEIQEAPRAELLGLIAFVHGTAGSDEPVLFLGAGLPSSTRFLHDVRSYTERWPRLRLELLAAGDTDAAFVAPAAARGVEIEPELLGRLRECSAGYPFFIQEYGSRCWPIVARRGDACRRRRIRIDGDAGRTRANVLRRRVSPL